MTIRIQYTREIKKQAKNPFCRVITPAAKNRLHLELRKRLLWLNQLGVSRDATDQEFYRTFVLETDTGLFGRSPEYDNAANTGISVLAGAVEKMYAGDLSLKQIKYISPVLDAMAHCYPKLWEKIDFEEIVPQTQALAQAGHFENLFDA